MIFTSDNGPHREGGHDPDFFRSSGPLRGIKRDLTEGGIRVPFIAWMPGTIPAGKVSHQPLAFWDMLPTFAQLAETRTPRGLDGISVLNLLLDRGEVEHPHMYWEFHEREFSQAIRDGKWKAIRKGIQGKTQLYDLKKDPQELHDLASQEPGIVARMETLFRTLRTDSAMFPIKPE